MIALLRLRLHCYNVAAQISFKRSLNTREIKECYDLLKVQKSSTTKEIKESFLRLSKVYHPDNKLTGSHLKFVELKQAYDAIKDGPPAPTNSHSNPFSNYDEHTDLSHKAHAYYREQTRDFGTAYQQPNNKQYGFGGPYGRSSTPWEDLQRDRDYRKRMQQQAFSGTGSSMVQLTILLGALAWIIICSSLVFMWDFKSQMKRSLGRYQTQQFEDMRSYQAYMRQREEAIRTGQYTPKRKTTTTAAGLEVLSQDRDKTASGGIGDDDEKLTMKEVEHSKLSDMEHILADSSTTMVSGQIAPAVLVDDGPTD